MDIISKQTRIAFREHLVGWTLGTITDLFDAADVARNELAQISLSGQRRTLVEEYYASVDWASHSSVRKVLAAYEQVLLELDNPAIGLTWDETTRARERKKLLTLLNRDGFILQDGRLKRRNAIDLTTVEAASTLVDREILREHLGRIENCVDSDPSLAVGSAKELIESVAKQILHHFGKEASATDSLQQVIKAAMSSLNLSIEAIPEQAKGTAAIKQLLAGLNQVVGGAAELRNLYGTGHGRNRRAGLQPRHARLVVGAVATLATFLLETLDERKGVIRQNAVAPY